MGATEPVLKQRAGGGEDKVGHAQAGGQQQQDLQCWIAVAVRFPARPRRNRQQRHCRDQQPQVHQRLAARRKPARQEMGVGITAHQEHLEKQQASRPHTRPAAKPRQDILANERLNLEQQESSDKDRERINRHHRSLSGGLPEHQPKLADLGARVGENETNGTNRTNELHLSHWSYLSHSSHSGLGVL